MIQCRKNLSEYPDRMEEGQAVIRILRPKDISAKDYFDVVRVILNLPYTTREGVKTDTEEGITTYIYFHEIEKVRKGVSRILGDYKGDEPMWNMDWLPVKLRAFPEVDDTDAYLDCTPQSDNDMEIVYHSREPF